MENKQYQKLAGITDHKDYTPVGDRIGNPETARLLHYTMGLSTEAAEVLDIIKAYVAYNRDIDLDHLQEELGDCLWFISRLCDYLRTDMGVLMDKNIAKLEQRYGDKFSADRELKRDKLAELAAMKGASK
jgi:NTP pyrophosphatase (non-canonical NTP hydrolase)